MLGNKPGMVIARFKQIAFGALPVGTVEPAHRGKDCGNRENDETHWLAPSTMAPRSATIVAEHG